MRAEEREAIAAHALALCVADQTEVLVSSGQSARSRFTHENVHQHVAESDTVVSVRAIVDGRTGVANTNRLDEASLQAVVERAIGIAQLAAKDPAQGELPGGGSTTAPVGAYVEATARTGAIERAALCEDIFSVAEHERLWCAGYVSNGVSGCTIVNSNGMRASFDGTDAAVNVKMNAADSTGFAEAYTNDTRALGTRAIAQRAADKARETAAPQAVEPGEWTVILEPPAFGELLLYLLPHFSAQAFDEGSSFCSDGLDRSYVAPSVTIHDDFAHPLAPGMPFDFEGQPKQRVPLVENGVVRAVVTDSYWARKLDRENTGHALPAPNAFGPQPLNAVVAAGSASTQELIASTKRGLLISRFWYIRTVDQKRVIVTGMTRDGTYLIENGKLKGGVRNLRFNQSIVEALRAATFSSEQMRTGDYSRSLVVPAAKIERFRFSSTTEF